jgi:hypothetical protein
MSTRLHYTNRIDASGVTISATSEQTDLPASNVANAQRTRVWRTGTSTATERIVFDFGSAVSITSVVLLDHTLTSGDAAAGDIKVKFNTSDSWASPAASETLTYAADTIYKVFNSQSYRYAAVEFVKASAGVTRDIGRIYLGTYVTFDRDPDRGSLVEEPVDLSSSQMMAGGQTYTWARDTYRDVGMTFTLIDATEKGQIATLADAVGTHTPFFFYLTGIYDTPLYVRLKSRPRFPVTGGAEGGYLYDSDLKLIEQL